MTQVINGAAQYNNVPGVGVMAALCVPWAAVTVFTEDAGVEL